MWRCAVFIVCSLSFVGSFLWVLGLSFRVDNLEATVDMLERARAADDAALALRDGMVKDVKKASEGRRNAIDAIAGSGDVLDDAAFLDGLRGVFLETPAGADAPRGVDGGHASSERAGGTGADD